MQTILQTIMSDKYIVSARKYRPATFRSVVGQKELTDTLRNSIKTGRLAQAYLFCGPRGVGKTSCARIFARTVNCMNPTPEGEACGECESCKAIERGNSYNLMELDAASNNSVDNIREISEQVAIPPQIGKYRIFIIDEVHMLSSQAFNAFLKTLEEPPSYAVFILATTEKHKVIPTILSRCQIYDFKRITVNDIADHLKYVAEQEGITADPRALGVIARKADGAMRDALSIFDQIASSSGGNITYESVLENLNVLDYDYFFKLVDDFRRGDVAGALLLYGEVRDRGFDSLFFINSVAQHVRDLMVAADPRTKELLETPDDISTRLSEQASQLPLPWYYSAMELLNECDMQYRTASNKQFLIELTLIRLCQLLNPAPAPFDRPARKQPLRDPVAQQARAAAPEHKPEQTSVAAEQPSAFQQPAASQPRHQEATQAQKQHGAPVNPNAGAKRAARGTISLNAMPQTEYKRERLREFVTPEGFMNAWHKYIAEHPDQFMLCEAMRSAKPVPDQNESLLYRVLVQHPAQLQAFEAGMGRLTDFLRQELRNDFLAIHAEIDKSNSGPEYLRPTEFLKKVMEENPAMQGFIKDLDGELV